MEKAAEINVMSTALFFIEILYFGGHCLYQIFGYFEADVMILTGF